MPFFLTGGLALGSGRGDEILPLPDLPEREIWLVTPALEVSTASVFQEFRELTADREVSSMGSLVWGEGVDWEMAARVWNDLEPLVMRRFPEVCRVYNALVEAGAGLVRLSGSGATWLALLRRREWRTRSWKQRCRPDCRVFRVRTLSRPRSSDFVSFTEGEYSMHITEVKVFPVDEEKLRAFVSIVFDDCFMVNDIKVIQGKDGLFISMPSRKKRNGKVQGRGPSAQQ